MSNNTTENEDKIARKTEFFKETIKDMIKTEKTNDKVMEVLCLFASVNGFEESVFFCNALKELKLNDEDFDNLINYLKKYSSYCKGTYLQHIIEEIDNFKFNLKAFGVCVVVSTIIFTILHHFFG